MKNLLVSKLTLATLSLASTAALAHPGHIPNESVHGLLHIEHIIVLVAVGVIAYAIKTIRNK